MSEATEQFINYWRRFSPLQPPYVHPDDMEHVKGAGLELSLLPVPVIGDIQHAEVVVLMLNPGLADSDYSWEENAQFREAQIRCAHQSLDNVPYPFFYLDPSFKQHGGAAYWIGGSNTAPGQRAQRKLRTIAEELARRKGVSLTKAQQSLATRVAVLQQLPYHSRTLKQRRLLRTLPSSIQARALVEGLVRESEKLLVVPRSVTEWGFRGPLVTDNLVVYGPTYGASASLTLRSPVVPQSLNAFPGYRGSLKASGLSKRLGRSCSRRRARMANCARGR